MLGDGRVALHCFDNVARTGLIRGTMRRRVWINIGDIVLIGLREFQPDKADIIHKYNTDEARSLQSYGELPASAKINVTAVDMAMDEGDDDDDEDEARFDFDDGTEKKDFIANI
jgi:translation initiation factor 1A